MNLRLPPTSLSNAISPTGIGKTSTTGIGSAGRGTFSVALKDALVTVSKSQSAASQLQREVQLENPSVSLEETMVAIQKAQIGFQATMHVRNRMVQAYTDIMNMQV